MPFPFSEYLNLGKAGWSAGSFLWRWFRRHRRNLTPQEKLDLRLKWKPEVEKWVAERKHEHGDDEVIVRDMRRLDEYPEPKETKGISPWFKVELVYTYDRGMMLGLGLDELKWEGKRLRFCNWKELGDVTLLRTGYVPYECIERIDWDGDRIYSEPHIFCYFDQAKGQPYERVVYCAERETSYSRKFYVEMVDYDDVRRLSKRLGVRRYP